MSVVAASPSNSSVPDAGWADIVADVAPRPGASFAGLLSWTLDFAESTDLFSEWERFQIQEAVAEHLARLTGEGAEKLAGVLGHLFAIAHRRVPAGRKAPGANVRREGRYRVAIRYMRIAS